MKNKTLIIISVMIFAVIILAASFSYAYFSTLVDGNNNAKETIVKAGVLSLKFNDGTQITAQKVVPGWEEQKTFTITNTGTVKVYYDINWIDVINTFERFQDLVFSLEGSQFLGDTQVPITNDLALGGVGIEAGDTHTFILKVKYLNRDLNQSMDMNKSFSGKIQISESNSSFGVYYDVNNLINITDTTSQNISFSLTNFNSTAAKYYLLIDGITNNLTNSNSYELLENSTVLASGPLITTSGFLTEITMTANETKNLTLKLINSSLVGKLSTSTYSGNVRILDYKQAFYYELKQVEHLVNNIIETSGNYIGEALSSDNYATIRGIKYWVNWHRISEADLTSLGIKTYHAPFIVKYTTGDVQSIPGELIDGVPVHTINYTSSDTENLYIDGILSGVDKYSTRSATQFGEFVIAGGTGQYDGNGGLLLGSQYASLEIDQTRPVNEKFSINITVKGDVPQTNIETFPRTIVAISDTSSKYLVWVGIRNKFLHVYSFYDGSAKASIDREETVKGFTSIDLTKPEYGFNFNNTYLNIQVAAKRGAATRLYINGVLFQTFESGDAVLSYGKITVGDLRSDRKLKYEGAIYNLALYSEVIDDSAVLTNWNYTKAQLNIN